MTTTTVLLKMPNGPTNLSNSHILAVLKIENGLKDGFAREGLHND